MENNEQNMEEFHRFKSFFCPPGVTVVDRKGQVLTGGFTFEQWKEHIEGTTFYGALLRRKDNRVWLSMYDLDVSPRNAEKTELYRQLKKLKQTARQLLSRLMTLGFKKEQILVEFSGTGYHLWLFYDSPVYFLTAAQFMQRVAETIDSAIIFKPKAKENENERVWLPLRINANQNKRSVFISDLPGFDPSDYQPEGMGLLAKVIKVREEQIM